MFDRKKQSKLNDKHTSNPQPGDYWQEHLVGICVVLAVVKNHVIYCKEKKECENNQWTWDLEKTDSKTIVDFKNWLAYVSIEGYWADVMPGHHKWALSAC